MTDSQPTMRKMLDIKNFRWLYLGGTVSLIGDFIYDVAVMLWITSFYAANTKEIALVAALSGICTMGPALLFGPIAGVFVDRWNKKDVLIFCNAIEAIMVIVLIAMALCQQFIAPIVIVITGLLSLLITNTAAEFVTPAQMVVTARVVPSHARTIATSLTMSTAMVLSVAAPPFAGPLFAIGGMGLAMAINLATFIAALAFLAKITTEPEPKNSSSEGVAGVIEDAKEGVAFVLKDAPIRAVFILMFSLALCIGAVKVQMVLFLVEVLHWDRKWYGLLFAIVGASAAIGSVLAPRLIDIAGRSRIFTGTLIGLGIGLLTMGTPLSPWLALAGVFLTGLASGVFNVFVGPLMMERVADNLLGRVSSLLSPMAAAGSLVSMTVGGIFLANHAGHTWDVLGFTLGRVNVVFFVTGTLFLIVTVLFSTRVFRPTEPEAEEPTAERELADSNA